MSDRTFVPTPELEEYSERFRDYFTFERRADGVLLVRGHTRGGPIRLSVEDHRALGQMLKTVGADPENEILPRDRLIDRAWELADHIMSQPRTIRRLTTQIVRRPWRQRITDNLDGAFGIQMFGHVAEKANVHGEGHIRGTVDYVREGRRNGFDR